MQSTIYVIAIEKENLFELQTVQQGLYKFIILFI